MFLEWVSDFSSREDSERGFDSLPKQSSGFVVSFSYVWEQSFFSLTSILQHSGMIFQYVRLSDWCLVQISYDDQKVVSRRLSIIFFHFFESVMWISCIKWFGRIPSVQACHVDLFWRAVRGVVGCAHMSSWNVFRPLGEMWNHNSGKSCLRIWIWGSLLY